MPNSLELRYQPQLGVATWPDFKRRVVLSGGQTQKTTEIFDIDAGSWSLGPDIPVESNLQQASVIPYEDSFLIIGGTHHLFG